MQTWATMGRLDRLPTSVSFVPVVSSATYATWDPANVNTGGITLSNGNLTATTGAGSTYYRGRATQSLSGKQYWEIKPTSITSPFMTVGICNSSFVIATTSYLGSDANGYGWENDGGVYLSAALQFAASSFTTTDTLNFAFDSATGKFWIGKNGTWQNSGDPAAGTGQVITAAAGTWYPAFAERSTQVLTANFGATAFTNSVPSGFNAGVYT